LALKTREAWKYVLLKEVLESEGVLHEFEFLLPGTRRVYDLALLADKTLVEFDGPKGHGYEDDRVKDRLAREAGWGVLRIPVPANTVIDPGVLVGAGIA
jgi:hypothetical protein